MKFLSWLVGIVALIGLLVFGFDAVRARRDEADIRAKVALLKSHGWPTCGADMPKGSPEGENAYLLIAPHIVKNRQTVTPQEPITKNISTEGLLEPSDADLLRRGLELDRPVLDIAAKAFRERKLFFVPRKWDEGFSMLLPDLSAFKGLNAELLGEVVQFVRAGKMAEARERLSWCHRMEKATATEPIVISVFVARSMMIQEQRCLLRLLHQGQPVLPLLKETQAEWASWKIDFRGILATELMTGLTTARYLDSNAFWRDQSYPWRLLNKDMNMGRYDLKFPVGDSIPKAGGARRKLGQALDLYLKFDARGASVSAAEVEESIHDSEKLWTDVPMFSALSVTGSSGSEPTMRAQLEMARLQADVLGCLIAAIESKAGSGRNPWLDRLSQEKNLLFNLETGGGRVVLTATEGANEVMRVTYPVELDEKYSTYASKRKQAIDQIERALNPKKTSTLSRLSVPAIPPPAVAPAGP